MHTRILTHILLPLITIIAIVDLLALKFYWFWIFWWIDVIMHVLGGLWVGLGIFWILLIANVYIQKKWSNAQLFFYIVFGTLIVGVLWEVFEYFSGLFIEGQMFPDAIHDMFADLAGALIAYTYAITRKQKSSHNAIKSAD